MGAHGDRVVVERDAQLLQSCDHTFVREVVEWRFWVANPRKPKFSQLILGRPSVDDDAHKIVILDGRVDLDRSIVFGFHDYVSERSVEILVKNSKGPSILDHSKTVECMVRNITIIDKNNRDFVAGQYPIRHHVSRQIEQRTVSGRNEDTIRGRSFIAAQFNDFAEHVSDELCAEACLWELFKVGIRIAAKFPEQFIGNQRVEVGATDDGDFHDAVFGELMDVVYNKFCQKKRPREGPTEENFLRVRCPIFHRPARMP